MNSWHIGLHMVKQMIGSRKGVVTYLLIPCMVIALAISVIGGEGTHQSMILYLNQDSGPAGESIIQQISSKSAYLLKAVDSEQEMKDGLISQRGNAGFIIPPNLSKELLNDHVPEIKFYELKVTEGTYLIRGNINTLLEGMRIAANRISLIDTSEENKMSYLQEVLTGMSQHNVSYAIQPLGDKPVAFSSNVTGLMLMFLMFMMNSTVSLIVQDRVGRRMMRMYSAPVRSWEIALGNFLGSFLVGMLQILTLLAVSRWLLNYNFGLPFLQHFIILATFMLVSIGIACAIAGLIRSPQQIGMLSTLIVTPTCMLGGCFWPLSIVPEFMQKVANFIPQKWAIQAIQEISAGGGWNEIMLPLLILGLMAFILLAIGSVVLRPSESSTAV